MESQTAGSTVGRNRRIILFPWPFQGHLNPMLQLANILYSKGFSITILHTNFNAPKTSNYPHFIFRPVLDNDQSLDMRAFVQSFFFKQNCADALRDELELLLQSGKDDPVSCLITDAVWHSAQSVADSLNLPRLVLRTSSLFSMVVYGLIPTLHDRGLFKFDNNELEEQVAECPVLKVKDIYKMGIKGKDDPVMQMMNLMMEQTKASSGIIWNSFKELEESELETVLQDFPVRNFLIPFPKHFIASSSSLLEQDRTFFPWLDQQPPNSVLYVSFGSISHLEEKDFLEIAHGLVDSKQPFLWVIRPDSPELANGSTWLKSLPDGFLGESGRVVKWAPQQEVLAHKAIGAFWTHNGWNSTMESICEGVAMICSPIRGDQPLSARYVSDLLKVGVYLENELQRQEIASAIRRVMVDEEGTEIRERAKVLKQKLDASLDKGGSSYESLESLVGYISSLKLR